MITRKNNINWNKEYVKYIKYLQTTKKYRGFSYPCLATQRDIRKNFQQLKKKYMKKYKNSYRRFL
jgi:hypothetical protein